MFLLGAVIGLVGCFLLRVALAEPPHSRKATLVGVVLVVGGAELAVFNAPWLELEGAELVLAAIFAPVALVAAIGFSGTQGKGRGLF